MIKLNGVVILHSHVWCPPRINSESRILDSQKGRFQYTWPRGKLTHSGVGPFPPPAGQRRTLSGNNRLPLEPPPTLIRRQPPSPATFASEVVQQQHERCKKFSYGSKKTLLLFSGMSANLGPTVTSTTWVLAFDGWTTVTLLLFGGVDTFGVPSCITGTSWAD